MIKALFASGLMLVALNIANAQGLIPSFTDQPVSYTVLKLNDFAIPTGSQPHDFHWQKSSKIGGLEFTEYSTHSLVSWTSAQSLTYSVSFISVGVDRYDRTVLGRSTKSSATISLDLTGVPFVGDRISSIFNSISLDHSVVLGDQPDPLAPRPPAPAPLRGRFRRRGILDKGMPWLRDSSISWETKPLTWRSVKFSVEGGIDLGNKDEYALVRVAVASW